MTEFFCFRSLQNDVHLIKIGDKVGPSEATLLNMLNISPFSYGLIIRQGKNVNEKQKRIVFEFDFTFD